MPYPKEKLEALSHRWATPSGKKLIKLIKQTNCYLNPILFHQKVHKLPFVNDEEVKDSVDLRGANLAGFDFRISVQEDDDGFLEELAILSNIHFEGANLKHCNFTEGKLLNCNFENANLSHAEFRNATLNECNFTEADLNSISLHGAKLISCSFTTASIKDVSLDSTLVDEKTHFGKTLKSEQEKNYHFAAIEYKQIKEMYKNSSLHNQADFYHYKEMVAKRKTAKFSSPKRWANYLFGDLLCKYGISYIRIFIFSLIIIVACAFMLNSQRSLIYNGMTVETSLLDAIYFSLITFTTLGYGDFHAIGLMRFVAGAESFAGVVLMSLFTVVVARKIIRD